MLKTGIQYLPVDSMQTSLHAYLSSKRGESALVILGTPVCVGDSDTGINPSFVHIQPTAVFAENLKRHSHLS